MALDRTFIVVKALDLLDEVGLEGLSMRRLADALEVQAPAIYWHFPGKPALIDAMAEVLVQGVADKIDTRGGYAETLRSSAYEMRRALLGRRDGARVFAGTFVARPNVLDMGEIVVGALRKAGFEAAPAARAVFTLMYYVMGFVIEEQALLEQTRRAGGTHPLAGPLEELDALTERYPNIRASIPEMLATDQDARFAFGVELLLSGILASRRSRLDDNLPESG
ncbi:TetR/AcrR family transcriptional regulator C-terminal domain-containing protein [Halodurantibacterium flavum]|uniref:TetR/AcrR family transcriptional regulator C-terminal domain-containing protein n=1 Tax=Halodurantibacterium flavum TaxID=1382802 RepID=A0ABW4S0X2_9RHOB